MQVSNDGRTWGAAIANGSFPSQVTELDFSPVTAQYIRVTQTGTDPLGADHAPFWSIDEFNVFAPNLPEPQ